MLKKEKKKKEKKKLLRPLFANKKSLLTQMRSLMMLVGLHLIEATVRLLVCKMLLFYFSPALDAHGITALLELWQALLLAVVMDLIKMGARYIE